MVKVKRVVTKQVGGKKIALKLKMMVRPYARARKHKHIEAEYASIV